MKEATILQKIVGMTKRQFLLVNNLTIKRQTFRKNTSHFQKKNDFSLLHRVLQD